MQDVQDQQYGVSRLVAFSDGVFGFHRLVTKELDEKTMTISSLRGVIPLVFFLLSIGLAFISPMLAKFSWFAIFLVRPVVLKWYTRNSEKRS